MKVIFSCFLAMLNARWKADTPSGAVLNNRGSSRKVRLPWFPTVGQSSSSSSENLAKVNHSRVLEISHSDVEMKNWVSKIGLILDVPD